MTTPPEPTATLAKPPFDDLRTDLILRANDGVEFHVFKNILSLCSTVFADMFDIAQSESQESSHDVPVVNLSEDSKALDYALRQCYPIQSPEVIELSDARNLLEFTRKYQINMLENTITHCLSGSIAREPVGVYAIAVTYGYKDLAVKAMQSSLKLPVSDLHSPELRFITAEQYQALLRYHIACGKAASAVSLERKWFPSWSGFIAAAESSVSCTYCRVGDSVRAPSAPSALGGPVQPSYMVSKSEVVRYGPRYLWSYLQRASPVLACHPEPEAVTSTPFVLADQSCHSCGATKTRDMVDFSRLFAVEITKAIAEVPFPNLQVVNRDACFSSSVPEGQTILVGPAVVSPRRIGKRKKRREQARVEQVDGSQVVTRGREPEAGAG